MSRTPQETMDLFRKMRTLCVPVLQRAEERIEQMRQLLDEKPKRRKKKESEGANRMEESGMDRSE